MSTFISDSSCKYPESIMKKNVSDSEDKLNQDLYCNLANYTIGSSNELHNPTDISRKDKYGNPIIKNNKLHKISFSDQFKNESSLVQIN